MAAPDFQQLAARMAATQDGVLGFADCAGQHFWLAESRRSPLATRITGSGIPTF